MVIATDAEVQGEDLRPLEAETTPGSVASMDLRQDLGEEDPDHLTDPLEATG